MQALGNAYAVIKGVPQQAFEPYIIKNTLGLPYYFIQPIPPTGPISTEKAPEALADIAVKYRDVV